MFFYLIHTMFQPNLGRIQLLKLPANTQKYQIQLVMQQFYRQIKLLQSKLVSELNFNTFLVEKAKKLPKIENQIQFALPPFDFCYKHEPDRQIMKNQLCQPKQERVSKIDSEKQINDFVNSQIDKKEDEEMKEVIKIQSKSFIKIEDEEVSSEQLFQDKNQTKNIPKNYGKAILSFIQKNIQKYSIFIRPILQKNRLRISDLLNQVRKLKTEVNSILYLKIMWGFENTNDPIFKCIRVLSHTFMRKYCLSYIFNSRIKNFNTHIKYRRRILQGIENPAEFTYIKQF